MSFRSFFLGACAVVMVMHAGCGSSALSVVGPVLDISEVTSISLDQFYVAAGLEDEYAAVGEFAVYLRDAVTGQDLACAGQAEGMDRLGSIQTYYGNLDIRMREVDGDHPDSSARFQLLFVEKDSPDCPAPIASGDDIIGTSPVFSSEDLLNQQIWAANGKGTAVLRISDLQSEEPPAMPPAMTDGLVIDQIGFNNGSEGNEEHRYYLFAERYESGEMAELCQIEDADFANVRFGNMIYAALDLALPCADATRPDFSAQRFKLSLWIQRDDGPAMIGETEVLDVNDMIGERLGFTNDKGYIRLRGVSTEPFSSRVARLAELADLSLTELTYTAAAAAEEHIEVHLRSPDGYSIACAGPDQGLVGVDVPDTAYTGLDVPFSAAEDIRELLGWETVDLIVVGRADGGFCPAPLGDAFTTLGEARELEPMEFSVGSASFEEGGEAAWQYNNLL